MGLDLSAGATSDEAAALGVEAVDLAGFLARSDVVSLHCPRNEDSKHLIGREELTAMRQGSYLIKHRTWPAGR